MRVSKRVAAIAAAGALSVAAPVVMQFEGLRTTAYLDPIQIPTVCYGHTLTASMGQTKSVAECEQLLRDDMQQALTGLAACVEPELQPHEWAALVSWSYNVGAGAACGSTLMRKLNAGAAPGEWCPELRRWVYAGGQRLAGLVRRREAELQLCLGR
ncbi:lysozyme [Microbulbifer salipaludis]|uniref:Lysozyme n=1 Tax=Microbulbifer salipaludis TaxID=187980 RepID=A0ABS3E967_9GAMM|nr:MULTISPECIES: lysozyme [Microbulbifer]MBN8431822.1 lysozyme [Microbulbifer salipaludis]